MSTEIPERSQNCKFQEKKMEDFEGKMQDIKDLLKENNENVLKEIEKINNRDRDQAILLTRFTEFFEIIKEEKAAQKDLNKELIQNSKEMNEAITKTNYFLGPIEPALETIKGRLSALEKKGVIDFNKIKDAALEKIIFAIIFGFIVAAIVLVVSQGGLQ